MSSRLNLTFQRAVHLGFGALALSSIVIACGDGDSNSEFDGGAGGSSASGGTIGRGGTIGVGGSGIIPPDGGGGSSASGGSGSGGACASAKAEATRQPVFLAFAFDASGSMGMAPGQDGREPWWDINLKWIPVRDAAKLFFNDAASRGISASLTFFPDLGGNWCSASSYTTPDVAMTALNGSATNPFSSALDGIDQRDLNSALATPTQAVMNGTITYVQAQRTRTPGAYAIVLVTDGEPAQCADNRVVLVENEARRALQAGIRTYVIGVNNPSPGPNTLGFLNGIATAGGTNTARIIATGNPTATINDFRAAVNAIRGQAVSCSMRIPAPPAGQTFNKNRVRVLYSTGTAAGTALTYNQSCTGANTWRYDNTNAPTQIVLCPTTCTTVQANPNAVINVEFTCNDEIIIVPE
jgi:hypothetical protein